MDLSLLISKILSLRERSQRAFSLKESLVNLGKEEIAELLEDIVNLSLRDDNSCKELLFSFTDILENIFDFEQDRRHYLFLATISEIKTSNRTLKFFIAPPSAHRFLKKGEVHNTDILMDYLPLGVKRSFAKKMDKNLLKRMLLEKDPLVVKHLLNNPLITEKEVLKIISSRPNTAAVIKVVFASEKWIKSYNVKEAIIKNPYSPFRISLLLLMSMNRRQLKQIEDDETLHPDLRTEAKRIEKLRGYLYK
ncbi:MAG: hypothetical protein OHK0040_13880 [bacterium]